MWLADSARRDGADGEKLITIVRYQGGGKRRFRQSSSKAFAPPSGLAIIT